ncbi:LRR receptor-like serine/threonine-protein kinase FLS2 [Morus notabilis]|uniref:LRR receptor-like serine/threonine-protein kinase FLS2 n=1 Tax=Morus notabilis TaxID=981085 RepID=W9RKR6_9ROSA|nr:LRR receptor-like serine/threonine-protein kinase FLS2 [Morus notabilis]
MLLIFFLISGEFISNTDAQLMDCLESDRGALLDFKTGLEDPKSRLSSWKGSNCCQWWGISCDKAGAVSTVDLHNLGGEIRPSLTKLRSLKHLDLSFNTFKVIPDWLVNISSLVTVDLSNSGLHGRIPLGFSELPNLQFLSLRRNSDLTASCPQLFSGRWEKINVLDLASNNLHGKLPSSIGNMTSLTYLDLSDNNVEGGIPSSIGKLCDLKFLCISGNNLTGALPDFLEGTQSCHSWSPLPSLQYLDLSNNQLVGKLPEWLGQVKSLAELDLSYNLLYGPIPASLGSLKNLTGLALGGNRLNGTLPYSLGQLSELSYFDVSFKQLTGVVNETHFLKQYKLRFLKLFSNSLMLNVSSNWVPPFQAGSIRMGSCHLGPSFPTWLRTQKEVNFLDFSNAGISDFVPYWFWDEISSNLTFLNVSFNQLKGHLPSPLNISPSADVDLSFNLFEGPIPLPIVGAAGGGVLDLSNNKLSGPIPQNISSSLPNLGFLCLSTNQIIGEIPASFGSMEFLQVIDLSSNKLLGNIPASIGNCSFLKVLDLSNNNLSGNIPAYLGKLRFLQTLHLGGNKLSGRIPSSLKNLSSLETLDLGNNRLIGRLPQWIGKEGLENLRILSLRSNSFSGELPSMLSNLSSLQVLDLAENLFNGCIPASFRDFKAMTPVSFLW